MYVSHSDFVHRFNRPLFEAEKSISNWNETKRNFTLFLLSTLNWLLFALNSENRSTPSSVSFACLKHSALLNYPRFQRTDEPEEKCHTHKNTSPRGASCQHTQYTHTHTYTHTWTHVHYKQKVASQCQSGIASVRAPGRRFPCAADDGDDDDVLVYYMVCMIKISQLFHTHTLKHARQLPCACVRCMRLSRDAVHTHTKSDRRDTQQKRDCGVAEVAVTVAAADADADAAGARGKYAMLGENTHSTWACDAK